MVVWFGIVFILWTTDVRYITAAPRLKNNKVEINFDYNFNLDISIESFKAWMSVSRDHSIQLETEIKTTETFMQRQQKPFGLDQRSSIWWRAGRSSYAERWNPWSFTTTSTNTCATSLAEEMTRLFHRCENPRLLTNHLRFALLNDGKQKGIFLIIHSRI